MHQLSPCVIALALVASGLALAAEAPPYRVAQGKVDESTFLGWRAFHSACHACHGVDAVGTAVAPNLLDAVKRLSVRDFTTKVLTSYRLVIPASEASGDDPTALRSEFLEEVLRRERGELVMPAWEGDEKMRAHVLDLYAYLRARADGALGPGRPERLED
jgi:mono/diheme cytochrome c family protein